MRTPLSPRNASLKVIVTIAPPAPDDPYEAVNSIPVLDLGLNLYGQIVQYPALRPETAAFAGWPPVEGGGILPLDGVAGGGPNYETASQEGIVDWHIVNQGRVPGILSIALWRVGQDVATDAPDQVVEHVFGTGAWDTGDLPVHTYEFDPEAEDPEPLFQAPAVRWFPAHLRTLAV